MYTVKVEVCIGGGEECTVEDTVVMVNSVQWRTQW